ncbi:DUF2232 domain-containing protein [Elusimicrobiota bacterium]
MMPGIGVVRDILKSGLISLGLLMLSMIIPVFGIVLVFLSVAPQIILLLKKKYSAAVLSWCLLLCILVVLRDLYFAAAYYTIFVVYAVCIYKVMLKKDEPGSILFKSVLGWLFMVLIYFSLYRFITGINLLDELNLLLKTAGGISIGKYYDIRLPQIQIDMIEQSIIKGINFLVDNITGISVIVAFICTYLLYRVINRYYSELHPMPVLSRFRLSENHIWILITSAGLFFLGSKISDYNLVSVLGSNLAIVMLAGYMLSGLGIVLALFAKIRLAQLIQVVLVTMIIFFLRGFYLLVGLGILDVWIDFRKRWSMKKIKENEI